MAPSVFDTLFKGNTIATILRLHGISLTYFAGGTGSGTAITAAFISEGVDVDEDISGQTNINIASLIADIDVVTSPNVSDKFTINSNDWAARSIVQETSFVQYEIVRYVQKNIGGMGTRKKL